MRHLLGSATRWPAKPYGTAFMTESTGCALYGVRIWLLEVRTKPEDGTEHTYLGFWRWKKGFILELLPGSKS